MIIAYIAHPIGGDVKNNLSKIIDIARNINLKEPNVVPFAPYFLDCHALNDDDLKERERGIKNDIALMKKGFINEVRLYGDKISKGMANEILLAEKLGIIVIPMTPETKKDYKENYLKNEGSPFDYPGTDYLGLPAEH